MEPIDLGRMTQVALLDRLETKYVMLKSDLLEALSTLADRYWVLDINGIRLHRYVSLYFDTPAFTLYYRHHAGRKNRYKIRSREYTDTQLAFLEIKHKINQYRTIKNRVQTPFMLTQLSGEMSGFLHTHYPLETDGLEPKLLNAYQRVTLISKHRPERLTLDLNPRFVTDAGTATLPGLAIAEVKYTSAHRRSDFMRRMREMSIRPMGFSKYCVGVSLLYPDVRSNNFKPTLRAVQKIMQRQEYVN
jgi:hypothetical protein